MYIYIYIYKPLIGRSVPHATSKMEIFVKKLMEGSRKPLIINSRHSLKCDTRPGSTFGIIKGSDIGQYLQDNLKLLFSISCIDEELQ